LLSDLSITAVVVYQTLTLIDGMQCAFAVHSFSAQSQLDPQHREIAPS
jgi:hypothetical protein